MMKDKISWIAVDWGTSQLRCYAMQGTSALAKKRSDDGVGSLKPGEFEPALLALIEEWLPQQGVLPMLACGMVGARQGWQEAAYKTVPCAATLSLGQATREMVSIPTTDSRIKLSILAGVCQTEPADVMRGEETQVAGLMFGSKQTVNRVICLPGTHSKWVRVQGGMIDEFSTFMTGEVFALLSKQSILKHSVSTGWDQSTFIAAVKESITDPAALLCSGFRLRADDLLRGVNKASATARLSGLLIGQELAGAKNYWSDKPVDVIGESALADCYLTALESLGINCIKHNPSEMTLAGLCQAYESLAI